MTETAPRRRMSRDERHTQLLEVARELIREDGADALTLARIAERAGVAKPLAYDHFGTKGRVVAELYGQFCARQDAALEGALVTAGDDLQAVAGVVAAAFIDCAAAEGAEFPGVVGALSGSAELDAVRQEADREFLDRCRSALAPFAPDGTVPDAAMHAILGAADGIARGVARGQTDADEGRATLARVVAASV